MKGKYSPLHDVSEGAIFSLHIEIYFKMLHLIALEIWRGYRRHPHLQILRQLLHYTFDAY